LAAADRVVAERAGATSPRCSLARLAAARTGALRPAADRTLAPCCRRVDSPHVVVGAHRRSLQPHTSGQPAAHGQRSPLTAGCQSTSSGHWLHRYLRPLNLGKASSHACRRPRSETCTCHRRRPRAW
jgi:hypothetical protein